MTTWSYFWTWLIAISITMIFILVVVIKEAKSENVESQYARLDCEELGGYKISKIVVIGSSLSGYAFPLVMPEGGVLADERSHTIWAVPNISAQEALILAGCALDRGAETIFLEVNSLIFSKNASTNGKIFQYNSYLALIQKLTNDFYRRVKKQVRGTVVPIHQNKLWWIENLIQNNNEWDGTRPAKFSLPERLLDIHALNEVKNIDVQDSQLIYLFEPPRNQQQVSDIEAHLEVNIQSQFKRIQLDTNVEKLRYWPSWPDRYFSDYGSHLNASGRERFQRELRVAWKRTTDAR